MNMIRWCNVNKLTLIILSVAFSLTTLESVSGQTRDEKVLRDREAITKDGYWLYDDVEKGFEAATKSKKPLMVVLRCIP